MPRLINADAYLDKVCTYKTTGCGSCKLQTMCPKDAQTVKAIPIEWIEEWGWKNGMSESMSLRVMIDDWEKENETN